MRNFANFSLRMQNENCSRFAARSVSAEHATFGVAHRATATIICLLASKPVARGNSRTMDTRRAKGRYFRTGGTCSVARHASGSLLCACVAASWMFCVLGLPCQAAMKARSRGKTTSHLRDPSKSYKVKAGTIYGSALQLQLIQFAPIWFALRIPVRAFEVLCLTNAISISVATRVRWQVQ